MANPSFSSEDIRNVALVGHGFCGKTSIGEAMLFNSGATTRLGRTTDQTGVLDFEPEEHKRGGSIATSVAWIAHEGKKINFLDTPGDGNFIYDAMTAMRGADAAVVVVSCPDGVEVQTERVFFEAQNLGMPRIIVVNKMDRDRADAEAVLAEIEEVLGVKPVPLQVPVGAEAGFEGVISLIQRKALIYKKDGSGAYDKTDVPSALEGDVDAAWEKLVEAVAETDDELLEQYFETFELSEEQVKEGFRNALKAGEIVPVLFTAASKNVGIQALMDLIVWAVPNPLENRSFELQTADGDRDTQTAAADGPFIAQVLHTFWDTIGKQSIFRVFSGGGPSDTVARNIRSGDNERMGTSYALRGNTRDAVAQVVAGDILAVAKLKDTRTNDTLTTGDRAVANIEYPFPMMSYTVAAARKGDEDKLKAALDKLCDEDPTLTIGYDELSKKIVLSGMGQAHLDLSTERMARKFRMQVSTDLPAVPYRETIMRTVQGVEGKHKKQTGGAGQFGVCYIHVEPTANGSGFEFVDKIVGGAIPRQFIPSVEKGIKKRMNNGFLAGYPITDLRVTLYDGKYHPVDSKDVAFQMAGSKGLRAAFNKGGTKLLEPIYKLEVSVPTDNMGDIMGDITSRRGRVMGMDTQVRRTVISAMVPLAEIQRYAPDLNSMTGGRGTFTLEFSGYEDLPRNLTDRVVAESPFRQDDDED